MRVRGDLLKKFSRQQLPQRRLKAWRCSLALHHHEDWTITIRYFFYVYFSPPDKGVKNLPSLLGVFWWGCRVLYRFVAQEGEIGFIKALQATAFVADDFNRAGWGLRYVHVKYFLYIHLCTYIEYLPLSGAYCMEGAGLIETCSTSSWELHFTAGDFQISLVYPLKLEYLPIKIYRPSPHPPLAPYKQARRSLKRERGRVYM